MELDTVDDTVTETQSNGHVPDSIAAAELILVDDFARKIHEKETAFGNPALILREENITLTSRINTKQDGSDCRSRQCREKAGDIDRSRLRDEVTLGRQWLWRSPGHSYDIPRVTMCQSTNNRRGEVVATSVHAHYRWPVNWRGEAPNRESGLVDQCRQERLRLEGSDGDYAQLRPSPL
jgi:hypothetical protein